MHLNQVLLEQVYGLQMYRDVIDISQQRRMRMMTAARSLTVVIAGYQSLIVVTTTTRKLGTISWSSYLIYKTLSCRAIYLSALKSYQKTLSYTVVVPYSRVLSYIPIYSVPWSEPLSSTLLSSTEKDRWRVPEARAHLATEPQNWSLGCQRALDTCHNLQPLRRTQKFIYIT